MLSPVDMPFVGRPDEPWMGTPPRQITGARTEIGVLGCRPPTLAERFRGKRFRTDLVRTFLKVGNTLPPEFGLTQAVAALPRKRAGALLEAYRGGDRRLPRARRERRHPGRAPRDLRRRRPLLQRLAPQHPAPG
ncbi:hypothetical protein [Nocardioides sp. TF02-7]|uniref:hypothetical protein n=1 Tax=Nocardioides sp. TF02-7 TaxID=2917724 RepID=UPI001F07074F|nr:hypothetical protein [Nocardioides sp. TF02-7]UMG93350.1 hypothetical protein MF408_03490 [Nocardioides sp. TF02-7]